MFWKQLFRHRNAGRRDAFVKEANEAVANCPALADAKAHDRLIARTSEILSGQYDGDDGSALLNVAWNLDWLLWELRQDPGLRNDPYCILVETLIGRAYELSGRGVNSLREVSFHSVDLTLSEEAAGLTVWEQPGEIDVYDFRGLVREHVDTPLITGDANAVQALAEWFGVVSELPPGSEVDLFHWRLRVTRYYMPPLPEEPEHILSYNALIWHRYSRMLMDTALGGGSNPLSLNDVFGVSPRPPRSLSVYKRYTRDQIDRAREEIDGGSQ